MKKRFLGLLCAAALLAMPAPVLAAENSSTVTEISTDISVDAEIDIRVKYEETASQNSTSLGSSESVTLQDGTTVTVESDREADREIRAMVILLNNAEGAARRGLPMNMLPGSQENTGRIPICCMCCFPVTERKQNRKVP